MMFSAFARTSKTGIRRASVVTARRQASAKTGAYPVPEEALSAWYNVFGKSTAAYGAWIVIGVLVTETVTGWVSTSLWRSANYGKTFETVDWTKFKSEDEDDEDDDEDEDEEEEEEEDDDDE